MFWVFFFFWLQDMWDLSYPTKLTPSALEGKLLTTGLPRKSLLCFFYWYFFFLFCSQAPQMLFMVVLEGLHLPLQLCTLLSDPGGWPVWTKVMGFHALWLGLANGTLSGDQKTGGEGTGTSPYLFPWSCLRLAVQEVIYSRSGAAFSRPSFQAQVTPLWPIRKSCYFQAPSAPCSPLSPTQFAICSCSLGK